jgi:hypothetical protein
MEATARIESLFAPRAIWNVNLTYLPGAHALVLRTVRREECHDIISVQQIIRPPKLCTNKGNAQWLLGIESSPTFGLFFHFSFWVIFQANRRPVSAADGPTLPFSQTHKVCGGWRKPLIARNPSTLPKTLITLLAVFAVFAVLVSPAPDELPGTTPHFGHYTPVLIATFLSLRNTAGSAFETLTSLMQSPSRVADRLTLQCTRLC